MKQSSGETAPKMAYAILKRLIHPSLAVLYVLKSPRKKPEGEMKHKFVDLKFLFRYVKSNMQ